MLIAQSVLTLLSSDTLNKIALLLIDAFAIWLIFRVYTSNPTGKVNRWFSVMSGTFLLWVNGGYFFALSAGEDYSLLLGKVILAIVIWSFVFLYFFLNNFPKQEKSNNAITAIVLLTAIVFSLLCIFSDFVVQGVNTSQWGAEPIYGEYGKISYYIAITILIVLPIVKIIRKYPYLSNDEKKKVQFFFAGIVVFLLSNLFFNVILPVTRNSIQFWQFGNYASIFLLGLTAFALIEHNLLDMKAIATEALTVVIWAILFSQLLVKQTLPETAVDLFVFLVMLVFGVLLIRSVSKEVRQRKKLQVLSRDLSYANEKLEELDKQKDEFINVAAHELRAPMTAIKGFLSMVNEGDTGGVSDKTREYITDAINGNERLIRLVNNMLNISRIEEGRMVFDMGTIKLVQVVDEVVKNFEAEAESKSLGLQREIQPNIQSLVYVDRDRIYEVLSNFVSNAVKYTEKGSITVRLSNPNTQTVRFECIDTGMGVAKDEQEKLFRKFERAKSSAGKVIGSGLGLYISKLLIEKFGGRVGLVSEYGKGSNFWFDLPIYQGNKPRGI